jgi:hypothetical protein
MSATAGMFARAGQQAVVAVHALCAADSVSCLQDSSYKASVNTVKLDISFKPSLSTAQIHL